MRQIQLAFLNSARFAGQMAGAKELTIAAHVAELSARTAPAVKLWSASCCPTTQTHGCLNLFNVTWTQRTYRNAYMNMHM